MPASAPEELKSDITSSKTPSIISNNAARHVDLLKAAGLVIMSNVGIFAEALQVFLTSGTDTVTGELDGTSEVFPPGLVIFSGAIEVFLVLVSGFVGISALFFDFHMPKLTMAATVLSLLGGWYVFVINVLAVPTFNYENNIAPPLAPLGGWDTRFREDIAFYMGYLVSSMAICAVSLGFHFATLLNLYRVQVGSYDKGAQVPKRVRMGYYSFLVTVLGCGMLSVGGWLRTQEGPGKQQRPVIYPPSIIVYPDVQVMTGLWVLLYGLAGFSQAFSPMETTYSFIKTYAVLLWAWIVGFNVMCNISLATTLPGPGAGLSGPGIQIACLFTSVCFSVAIYAGDVDTAMKISSGAHKRSTTFEMGAKKSVTEGTAGVAAV
mmetsp:Transcript_3222/g.6248  ORF Transcript_3222/g.6248 Transcript_3222/m.6248 type:complete len:377 (-) Transcript_3222:431-1561(-)